ncbi:ABC transporter ATP-binding protein [Actinokineospora enzanensis]|uniref:ABC transporter ATP-binding protein n=1 Tax=Actinokineospora enzanensis TaxID=155975 RepID=UPI000368B66A|nr:ABC transporter ATP-binding protein [Actinokineospora enzanensis]
MTAGSPTKNPSFLATVREAFQLSRQAGRGLFALCIAIPVVEGLLAITQLVVLRSGSTAFFSGGSPGETLRQITPWLVAAVAVMVISVVADNARNVVRELLTEHVKRFSASRMHTAIAGLDLIDFDEPEMHNRIARSEATADYRPVQVVRSVTTMITSAVRVIALAGFLLVLQPLLVLAVLAATAPVMAISARLAKHRFTFFNSVTPLERKRRYVGWLLTARDSAAEVRSFGLTRFLSERHSRLSLARLAELRKLARKQWRNMMVGQLTFALIISLSVLVLVWFYGRGLVDNATLLVALLGLIQLAGALGSLGSPLGELSEASLFLADQRAFYQHIERNKSAHEIGDVPGPMRELRVRNLSFGYPSSNEPVLKDVDLVLKAGQVVALVGPNGSGKTTLAKVLAFLYRPSEGSVTWNGVDTAKLSQDELRDRVATVFQDHLTYSFTVAENVAVGDVDAPEDRDAIRRALDDSGAVTAVDRLKDGLDTQLGPEFDGGTSFSGGEAQRLAVARAFYRDGRELMILDEPTSALDATADFELLASLRRLLDGRTAVVISHRFSNVRDADLILVLDRGRIIERGTHDSLMTEGGLYSTMYTLQASAYTEPSLDGTR